MPTLTKSLRRMLALAGIASLTSTTFAQNAEAPNEGSVFTYDGALGSHDFSWWGRAGYTYFIQQTDDLLLPWHYLPVIESGANAPLAWSFTSTSSKLFLRLRYSDIPTSDPFKADFDGDKVNNETELANGTDPLLSTDSDNDSLPDDWERSYFGNLSHSGTADTDNDGISDAEEFTQSTNPNSNDTDTDGMPDAWEVTHGLNPIADDARQDFDFDTAHNLTEFIYGTNPADHYNGTRPNIAPPQPTTASARVSDGKLRVEWNDNSISETAFAIYKRSLGPSGTIVYQLLGKETPAATLFQKPIAPEEVEDGDHIVIIAEPSTVPPTNYVAAMVNQPLMLRCNDAAQTFEIVPMNEGDSILARNPASSGYAPTPTMTVTRAPTKENMEATTISISSDMFEGYTVTPYSHSVPYQSFPKKKYSTIALNRVEGQDWAAFAEPTQNSYSASHNFQIGKVNTLTVYTGTNYQSAGGLSAFLDEKLASVSGEVSVHYYSDPYDPNPIIPSISAPHYLGTTHVGQWYHRDFDITHIPTTVNLLEWPILLGTWRATERNVVRDASFVFAGTHDLDGNWDWNGYELPLDTYATETLSYTVQDSYSYQQSSIPNRRRIIIPRAWGTVTGPAEKRFDPLADSYPTYFAIPEPNSYDTFNIHLHGNPGKASDHNTQWTVAVSGGVKFTDGDTIEQKLYNELNGSDVAFKANAHGEITFSFGGVPAGKIIVKAYPRRTLSVLHVGVNHVDPRTNQVSTGCLTWSKYFSGIREPIGNSPITQPQEISDEVWIQGGPNIKIEHHYHPTRVNILYKTKNNTFFEPATTPTDASELSDTLNIATGAIRGTHEIICYWLHHPDSDKHLGQAQPNSGAMLMFHKADPTGNYTFPHELGHALDVHHPFAWISNNKKPADSGKMIMGYYSGTGFPASQIQHVREITLAQPNQ